MNRCVKFFRWIVVLSFSLNRCVKFFVESLCLVFLPCYHRDWYLLVGNIWGAFFVYKGYILVLEFPNLLLTLWKNRRVYWSSCFCCSLYFFLQEDCCFRRCRGSTGLSKLWNRRSVFSSCFIHFRKNFNIYIIHLW